MKSTGYGRSGLRPSRAHELSPQERSSPFGCRPLTQPALRRVVVSYCFEGGSAVEIVITGNIPTAEALAVIDELIAHKRAELARLAQGIEARQGGDASCGSVEDESPVANGDAPKGDEG